MPKVTYDSFAFWSNYHMTVSYPPRPAPPRQSVPQAPRPTPMVGIQSLGRVFAADVEMLDGLQKMAKIGEALQAHITDLAKLTPSPEIGATPKGPDDAPFAAGMVGRGWSFAPLVGTPISQLLCDGIAHVGTLKAADSASPVAAAPVVLVGGGTRLRELANWATPHHLTVATSGTHLGPTLAGGMGTASHGSKLGYGGLQNMVLGMHIITGAEDHVWLERPDRPVLSAEGLAKLAIGGRAPRLVRDFEIFEACLVHLGSMGIVGGIALEMVEDISYGLLRRNKPIDMGVLKMVDSGDFAGVAAYLKCDAKPAFYEMTIDPQDPFGPGAYHTQFFALATASLVGGDADLIGASEAIVRFADTVSLERLLAIFEQGAPPAFMAESQAPPSPGDPVRDVLRYLLGGKDSAFAFYGASGQFDPTDIPHDPTDLKSYRWSELHSSDEITGGIPGALYNASFAIPREMVSTAIPAICDAVKDLPGAFIFTLRFVSNAAGTLAFTRFRETAVIEIDGLSPFICDLKASDLDPDDPTAQKIREILWKLGEVVPTGAKRVRTALDAAAIPFSMHWAKLGDLDAAKVHADYGSCPAGGPSRLERWRAARLALLPPESQALFWNEAVMIYGLL